jgi:hypothetical protein
MAQNGWEDVFRRRKTRLRRGKKGTDSGFSRANDE